MIRYPVRLSLEAAWDGHPYSRTTLGTEASLRSLTSDALLRWHESTVLSSATVAAAVGDVAEEELAQAMADAFAGIRNAPAVRAAAPTWPGEIRQRVDNRDKAQTAIALGFPGPTRLDAHRYAVGTLMLIASGLGGRFFDELRDKRSLAYTVQAWATERVSAGMFTAYIATKRERGCSRSSRSSASIRSRRTSSRAPRVMRSARTRSASRVEGRCSPSSSMPGCSVRDSRSWTNSRPVLQRLPPATFRSMRCGR
jgi:hypothetical protein